MVLQRVDSGRWRRIYQVKQRWVKKRDPEHTQYVLTLRFAPPSPQLVPSLACFVYANSRLILVLALPEENMKSLSTINAAFLLNPAIADNALSGLNSLEDVRNMDIPPGETELILRFNDNVINRLMLKEYRGEGRHR